MYGVLFAFVVFMYKMFFGHCDLPEAFVTGASFLFIWYVIFGVLRAFFAFLGVLAAIVGGVFASFLAAIRKIKLFAFLAPVASIPLSIIGLLPPTLLIVGAWVLKNATLVGIEPLQLESSRLIVGALAVFVGLFFSRSKVGVRLSNRSRFRRR